MKAIFTLLILVVSLTLAAQTPESFGMNSSSGVPQGLTEGTIAPEFEGIDQNGKKVNLYAALKNGPVVVLFYRGYWCPVCNRHLSKFQQSLSAITDKGATVIAISPEASEGVNQTIGKNGLTFSVISDTDYSIMDAYGVRFSVTDEYADKISTRLNADIAATNGDDEAILPVPATYVIGKDRKILKTFFDINYRNRPTAEEIAKHL